MHTPHRAPPSSAIDPTHIASHHLFTPREKLELLWLLRQEALDDADYHYVDVAPDEIDAAMQMVRHELDDEGPGPQWRAN